LPGSDIASWLSTVQDPTSWAVIGVSSLVPTISILDEPLKSSVEALLASARSNENQRPIPIFHFPHRFTALCAEEAQPTGYIDAPLDIRLSISFTITTWVRRGGSDIGRCFLSVESPHIPFSLLWLGNRPNSQPFTAIVTPSLYSRDRVDLNTHTSIPRDGRTWVHAAFVQQWGEKGRANEWSFFINGHKEVSHSISAPMVQLEGVRLAFGRGVWDNKRVSPWDGQIENVKVHQQALSEAEIADEASESNKPKATGAMVNDQGDITAY